MIGSWLSRPWSPPSRGHMRRFFVFGVSSPAHGTPTQRCPPVALGAKAEGWISAAPRRKGRPELLPGREYLFVTQIRSNAHLIGDEGPSGIKARQTPPREKK